MASGRGRRGGINTKHRGLPAILGWKRRWHGGGQNSTRPDLSWQYRDPLKPADNRVIEADDHLARWQDVPTLALNGSLPVGDQADRASDAGTGGVRLGG